MPDISVTDDQRERLGRVQEYLAADVAYGHVRPRDAVEYLLDRFEVEVASGGDADAGASSTATEPRGDERLAEARSNAGVDADTGFEVRNGHRATATRSVPETADGTTDASATGDSAPTPPETGDGDDTDDAASDGDAAADAEDDPDGTEAADAAEATDETDETDATDAAGDGDARLSSVMSLLDDHDDVWREADGSDAKYEVDLPDGGTERARTKDDVRAVLFRHYR